MAQFHEPGERMKVSAILPTMGRPAQALACIRRMFETAESCDLECIAVVEHAGDLPAEAAEMPNVTVVVSSLHRGPVSAWNEGLIMADGDAFVTAGDDLWWHDGWLVAALAHMTDTLDFVGLNDGHYPPQAPWAPWATHFLATRRHLIEVQNGVLAIPVYRSWCTDMEMCRRAQRAGRYVMALDAVAEHRHPDFGTASMDDTYRAGYPWHQQDIALYNRRTLAGFPDDFNPVLR
jgi:glycosyltransferase involved in cell wall biosynthesis